MTSKPESRPTVRRRDAAGHIDPTYARELLALSGRSDGDERGRAFLERPCNEELSRELGEAFLESATSGEEAGPERVERVTALEEGGPFMLTSARREFARGVDESNPCGATKEPFPCAVGGGEATP